MDQDTINRLWGHGYRHEPSPHPSLYSLINTRTGLLLGDFSPSQATAMVNRLDALARAYGKATQP